MRTAVLITMVLSFVVLGGLDLRSGSWNTGLAAILLGAVQALVFWGPK